MPFKNFKNKLLIFIILFSIFSMPISTFAYSKKVVLGGENIGISINSKGVLVVGFYNVGKTSPGKDANLQIGDIITKIDDTDIKKISDLSIVTINDQEELQITYLRNNKTKKTTLKLTKDKDNSYKTGLYVKDKIIGIGTLSFIDPETKTFAGLGHEITEKTTGTKFEIKDGTIFKSDVTSITKSTINNPGEKNATFNQNEIYGIITDNKTTGIYGIYQSKINTDNLIEVASLNEITLGKAYIHTVISNNTIEKFEINIIKINHNDKTKNILFEITDKRLLSKTGGIVQGMSGSPITQNNKLVGAVNYVIVDSPTMGYGILIENMLNDLEN